MIENREHREQLVLYLRERELPVKKIYSIDELQNIVNGHRIEAAKQRKKVWKSFFKAIPKRDLKNIKLKLTIPELNLEEIYRIAASVGRDVKNCSNIKINVANVD